MSYINGGSVIAIGVLFPILGTAVVAARFYIRRSRKLQLGLDDWLCLPALVCSLLLENLFDLLADTSWETRRLLLAVLFRSLLVGLLGL